MKTFFTLVATGLLVVLVIQMAVEFRPEHMCVIWGLVVFLGGTFVFVVSVSGAMAGYYEEREVSAACSMRWALASALILICSSRAWPLLMVFTVKG